MDQILPYLFILFLIPGIFLAFFRQYFHFSGKCKYFFCILYLLLNAGFFLLKLYLPFPGGLWLLQEACLPALLGSLIFHYPFLKTLPVSTLSASTLSVCEGVVQCVVFWYAAGLPSHTSFLKYLDSIQFFLTAVLFSLLVFLCLKAFPPTAFTKMHSPILLLLIPIFFISLTERTISDAVYGSITIWDDKLGLIYPVVEHKSVLLLQLFAGVCLFAILFIWKKLTNALLLEQQLRTQTLYLEEICSRYEQTCSFRHDIKNHLTVIRELLNAQEFQNAAEYLSHLEETTDSLSWSIHTGRKAVDALLGSKLALADRNHMNPQCELLLPDAKEIPDMDWCILLSNGLDNAIHANGLVPSKQRMLKICGNQKGNLYLISIENACPDTLDKLPEEGTGLSNIRAVAKKYGGTVHTSLSHGRFRLDILLVIS